MGSVFDEKTIDEFKSISAAANLWQMGFIKALQSSGSAVTTIGYPAEQIWPYGRFLVRQQQAKLIPEFNGLVTGYINVLGLRKITQYMRLRQAIRGLLKSDTTMPDYSIVYYCQGETQKWQPSVQLAKYLKKKYNVPWICIVADGVTPEGADRYIFLPWSNYQSGREHLQCLHLDGGIAEVNIKSIKSSFPQSKDTNPKTKVLMYMGALTEHGGVTQLARAFVKIPDDSAELWICGRGENSELDYIARNDSRIKIKGFVDGEEIDRLSMMVYAFVNPRPSSFAPNKLNYPSKLLHYLAYGKPVISTFTEGMSPEYEDVLVRIVSEEESMIVDSLRKLLMLDPTDYRILCQKVDLFNQQHTWKYQIGRFLDWLKNQK
jgi:glycosyltransferase involved in cell wall biosynthesis